MKLSAIVPTHNRPDVLERCLETLQSQDADSRDFEVVVVDDGSEVDVPALVSRVAARGPIPMRCERQELGGLNRARNRGVAASHGEVLAFLDDDTLVSAGWASALLRTFSEFPCAGIGGKVELALEAPAPPWLAARAYYLAEYDLGPESRWLRGEPHSGGDPLPVGANCAVRRREFDRLDGFRSGLDRIGGSLVSNGDTDFFRRLRASGGRMRYEAQASVLHCVPRERLTLRYFAKRSYAQGISDELLFADPRPYSWRRRLGRARFAVAGLKMLGNDMLHGRGYAIGWFHTHYWAGRFAAYRRQR